MTLVTISDHNTLEGALRITNLPGTFLGRGTTRFSEDEVPMGYGLAILAAAEMPKRVGV
jgi:hypothetical protein